MYRCWTMHLCATTNFVICLSTDCRRSGSAELLVALGASPALSTWEVQAVEGVELCSLKNNTIPGGQNQDLGVLGPVS